MTDLRIEAPAPRKGLMACFDQPTFPSNRLPLIPRGAEFVIGSFDVFGSYAKIKDLMSTIDPDLAKEIAPIERVREAIGLQLTGGSPPLRSQMVRIPASLAGWRCTR